MDKHEEAVREEVSDRLGRELTDAVWRDMYDRAQKKLRHIVALFGDADGARNTVDYAAQLTIEAIREDALRRWTAEMYEAKRNGEPTQRPTPPRTHEHHTAGRSKKSSGFCMRRAHT